jgi:hypothetical protein
MLRKLSILFLLTFAIQSAKAQVQLDTVNLGVAKRTDFYQIGKVKEGKKIMEYATTLNGSGYGRLFEVSQLRADFPYIHEIVIETKSKTKRAKAQIKIYSVDESLDIIERLDNDNIFFYPKKGRRNTSVDLEPFSLRTSDNLVVMITMLDKPENEFLMTVRDLDGATKKFKQLMPLLIARKSSDDSRIIDYAFSGLRARPLESGAISMHLVLSN